MAKKQKVARGKYRFVMMTCGYVESAVTSWLIYTSQRVYFKTAEEAVKQLALDMYAKFHDEHMDELEVWKPCCKSALKDEKKFCPDCGTQVGGLEFSADEFAEYVTGIHSTTCDTYGEAEYTKTRPELTFWPWQGDNIIGVKKNEVIVINQNAEWVLLDALCECKPELRASRDEADGYNEAYTSDWELVKQNGRN